jgi:hypothetical protein
VVIRDLEEGYSRARRAQDSRGPLEELTLISGAVLNCGGPLSRAPAALASLKLGVGELGGFTGSGTRRLGPPELFPEPGATPPAPVEAATLGSFLWKENGERSFEGRWVGRCHRRWAPKGQLRANWDKSSFSGQR